MDTITFDQLFKQISPEEISDNVFTLVGKIFPIITAGKKDNYNSMVASGGGIGTHFKKPNVDDFYLQETKDYLRKVYQDAGEITEVWINK
ncbi:MAG: hypothetical protein LBT46_12775 [Planctomycetaceae bacterium]|jgi:hypothetical protein|nr:hypothetical protein [Planctomycetaceae bacterium]